MLTANEKNYLMQSMKGLLDEYDYEYTTYALEGIIDEWATAKANLIQAFKKHPNYLEGQFMIAFDTDYERTINTQGSIVFSQYLLRECSFNSFTEHLPEEINDQRIADQCCHLPHAIWIFLDSLKYIAARTIDEYTANKINDMMPNIRAHAGEKTSRVINKICTYLGFSKLENYNKEFAKYADSLSPLKITRHTILSINPLDYLTMSFGNSWASCHTIDKANKRDMPNSYEGQFSSGTVSYMLDETSMVFYTVDASYNGTEYWNEPKINRQMFHYGEDKLIQGRLYPQSNDYGGDYTTSRNIVQKIIADIYEFANLWTVKKGTETIREYVYSQGTHYLDYIHFDKCTLSRKKGSENEAFITIGSKPICIECGDTHNVSQSINCCNIPNVTICECCGCVIEYESDICWVGDYAYCCDCVEYCERCNEYHRTESHYINSENRYVCEWCCNEYYCTCVECGEVVSTDEAHWHEAEGCYICDDCYNELTENEEEAC